MSKMDVTINQSFTTWRQIISCRMSPIKKQQSAKEDYDEGKNYPHSE
jgi:hypothetical protein